MQATGTFNVRITQTDVSELGKSAAMGRMTIDKVFSGGIDGTSTGEMLTTTTAETTALAYVALEKVTAKVDGKAGTFVLMHNAAMLPKDPANASLSVTVVPFSGTGDLSGIDGKLGIEIVGGVHKYTFTYTLPAKP